MLDLTLTISKGLPSFPGSPPPALVHSSTMCEDGYNAEMLFFSSHAGTHMDAPFHFADGGKSIHEVPLDRLVQNAQLIKIARSANRAISKSDIVAFEQKNGVIPTCGTVLFYTGWQKMLYKKNYFTQNPGLAIDAAKYLVSKNINLVGIDSPSIDLGTNHKFPVHHLFAKNDVLIVENLANLQKIKGTAFKFFAIPLKLENASGSPVRAFAI